MDARSLLAVFDAVYAVALTAWVGSILFFSFGVAPIIFRVLDPAQGARFVRALFPHYYAWGANWGGVALAALVCGRLTHPEFRGPATAAQAVLVIACVLVMLYGGNSLTPAINAARDAGPEAKGRFDRLHRRSVWLNGVVLLVGLGLIVAFAARPAPRRQGLAEPSPEEQARRHYEAGVRAIREFRAAHPGPAPGLQTPPPRPADGEPRADSVD